MSFVDACRLFAARYNWDANKVAKLTPAQAAMYADDLRRDCKAVVEAVFTGAESTGRLDPRFPGKRVRRMTMEEYNGMAPAKGKQR